MSAELTLRQVRREHILGRTLRCILSAGAFRGWLLVFTDGTACRLIEGEIGVSLQESRSGLIHLLEWSDDELIESGLATADQLNLMRQQRNEEYLKQAEASERRELARLLAKYPTPGGAA